MVLMWRALPFIRERRIFSVSMPNALNFAFDYATFITVGLTQRASFLCTVPGLNKPPRQCFAGPQQRNSIGMQTSTPESAAAFFKWKPMTCVCCRSNVRRR
jgi:hypothetical protein